MQYEIFLIYSESKEALLLSPNSFRFGPMVLLASAVVLGLTLSCGDDKPTTPTKNPVPQLSALVPDHAALGTPGLALKVIGSDFVAGSTVFWNGEERATVNLAADTLSATILAADLDPAAFTTLSDTVAGTPVIAQDVTVQVWVKNPEPGGGTSNALPFLLQGDRPVPTLASITPSTAATGSPDLQVTVLGTGFFNDSVVRWDSGDLVTAFGTSSHLVAIVPAALLTAPATASVTVFTPGPGGGLSNSLAFSVQVANPLPSITALNPLTVSAGGNGFTLEVTGTNFIAASHVLWNGDPRTTTFLSENSLQVTISASDIADGGLVDISVENPPPGGGTSGSLSLTVENPAPAIASIAPEGSAAGAAAFTLVVRGSGFVPGSTVLWNGANRSTSYAGSGMLIASIGAADVQNPGTATVAVRNAAPGGGESQALDFSIYLRVPLSANDLVYDPDRDRIFASVGGTGGAYANSIVSIDPASGDILGSTFIGSEPRPLARSDDGQYLYVGLDGADAVRRYVIDPDSAGFQFPLGNDPSYGPLKAEDIAVIPGSPHSIVASTIRPGVSPRHGGVFVYDDGVRRANGTQAHTGSNRIEPSDSPGTFYGYNNETTEFGLRRLLVTASGIAEDQVQQGVISGFGVDIHFAGGRIYATSGSVVDAATLQRVGTLNASGPMTVDPDLHRAYFLEASDGLSVHDTDTFSKLGTFHPADFANPRAPVRIGSDRLAFITNAYVVIVPLFGPGP